MVLLWRLTEILLLVIAVIASFTFLMLLKDQGPTSLPVIVAILSAVGVYFTDKQIKRLTQPQPIIIPSDFRGPLKIYRTKKKLMLLAACAFLFLAGTAWSYDNGKYFAAIFMGFMGSIFFLVFLSDIKKWGTPYLTLDEQAINTDVYGRIPWAEVDNAALEVRETRSSKIYLLNLSVYDPGKYFKRMSFMFRLLKMKWLELPSERGQLRIPLNMLSHEPRYIDVVVKHFRALYSRSIGVIPKTGDLSIDKKFSESDKLMASLESESDPIKIRSTMTKIDGLMTQARHEIQEQYKKGQQQSLILLLIFLIIIGLFVIAKFL